MPADQLIIPDSTRQQFSELVELIVHSESMNDEERQYWINILPIMTPDQIENLRGILDNEKTQLQAIDKKYAAEMQNVSTTQLVKKTAEQRRNRREQRQTVEAAGEDEDSSAMAAVLDEIENL